MSKKLDPKIVKMLQEITNVHKELPKIMDAIDEGVRLLKKRTQRKKQEDKSGTR